MLQVREDGAGSWLNVYGLGVGESLVWQTDAVHTFGIANGGIVPVAGFGKRHRARRVQPGRRGVLRRRQRADRRLYRAKRLYGATIHDSGGTGSGRPHLRVQGRLRGCAAQWVATASWRRPSCPRRSPGPVFEDVNYGGGAGRDLATSSGSPQSGAKVELYDGSWSFVDSVSTDGSGDYSFGVADGGYYVRVVNSTVTSSRTGFVASLIPVQTFRTDASSGSAVPVTNKVGGDLPEEIDAPAEQRHTDHYRPECSRGA